MSSSASAVADLKFSLEVAAERYRKFAEEEGDVSFDSQKFEGSRLLYSLADEREADATELSVASNAAMLELPTPTLSKAAATELLFLGKAPPSSPSAAFWRVERSNSILKEIASNLKSLDLIGNLGGALASVERNLEASEPRIKEAKRIARSNREKAGAGAPLPGTQRVQNGQEVELWFGTNREQALPGKFSSKRAQKITYGRCSVFVSDNRRVGSLGDGGLIGRILKREKKIELLSADALTEADFFSLLELRVAELGAQERTGIVFLHGYCTTFEDAARRTAQFKVDLQHKGPACFFSWPSFGRAHGYTFDEAAIEASALPIRKFIQNFVEQSNLNAVHIIAHSMGNRALLSAFASIFEDTDDELKGKIGQVILAAPDVDSDVFMSLAKAYGQLATRSTLYVSRNDRAIGLSRKLHRYHRVGLAPPVAVVDGIDTIDVSEVNLGFTKHGYAAGMRPVLTDIYDLLRSDHPPEKRFGLEANADGSHWVFKPG